MNLMLSAACPAARTSGTSLNDRAQSIVDGIARDAQLLRCLVSHGTLGERRIDLGAAVSGGFEAGRRMAEVSMGGLGTVQLAPVPGLDIWPLGVCAHADNPLLACLASQYAGWRLSDEAEGYFALGSGPARAQARIEDVFVHIPHREFAECCTILVESNDAPPPSIVRHVAQQCAIEPHNLTVIYAPTNCIAGSVQIAARVLEVAIHKAQELCFPLADIVDIWGAAPVAPVAPTMAEAMGRTNDAIIYGGLVHLHVRCSDAAAEDLARRLPSVSSPSYGKLFSELFAAADSDFYKLDKNLFSPAKVAVSNIATGRTFIHGQFNIAMLRNSFGL
ncbi:MAG: methenyltetrahydromethanopterin cyclohydrolase [Hyphomicrobium sp.]